MTTATFEKTCKNCDRTCKNNQQSNNCKDFTPMAELYELAHELGYDKIKFTTTTKTQSFLTNTNVKNCYTNKPFYKLNQKLSREEWQAVKKYFKYYNFEGLKGWATVNWIEVTEILVSLKIPTYNEIKEQIAFHEKQKHLYEIEDFHEHNGRAINLKHDLQELIRTYYPTDRYL